MPILHGYNYERKVLSDVIVGADRTWEGHNLSIDRDLRGNEVLVTADVTGIAPTLDISWLKAASEAYNISDDIGDYVFAEVPSCQAELPNRNLDLFPLAELTKFRPILGRIAYQSFRGKMTSANHENRDPLKATGCCFDSSMQKINDHWHVVTVTGWDRTKNPQLAKRILANRDAGYSMACLIDGARCSVCNFLSKGDITCKHIDGGRGKGKVWKDLLIAEKLEGLNFWELSHVEDRADWDCIKRWSK